MDLKLGEAAVYTSLCRRLYVQSSCLEQDIFLEVAKNYYS